MRIVTRPPRFLALMIGGAVMVSVALLSPRVSTTFGVEAASSAAQAQPAASTSSTSGAPIKILVLLQEQPQHSATAIYQAIGAPLARRGIQLTPALTPAGALTPERLNYYDALMIFGNHAAMTPDQEKALVDFVEGGKGVIAIHSAIEMFAGSERYAALVGAQGKTDAGSEFTAEIVQPSHPAVQGVKPFATWDEGVVYTKQNPHGSDRADGTRGREGPRRRGRGCGRRARGACSTRRTDTTRARGRTRGS